MLFFYQVLLLIVRWLLPVAALWHPRLKAWYQGRQIPLKNRLSTAPLWFHCSSLGEFEQARPLIEMIKQRTNRPVLLTFFSPSGYTVRKDYAFADQVEYLPLDTPLNARHFINLFQPRLLVLVKYDFWYNHMLACYQKRIPVILISGLFRPKQYFFRWYGRPFLQLLKGLDHCFIQDRQSKQLLEEHGFTQVTLAGDTRVDRVLRIPDENKSFVQIEEFAGGHPVWIWGSTWPEDENLLYALIPELVAAGWKIIIAPHDIQEAHLEDIEKRCPSDLIRMSLFSHGQSAPVLMVDNIGLLAYLYRYARLVYIGGGFGRNIHNVLEPMAYTVPVIFGPKYRQFREAEYLVKNKAGLTVTDHQELRRAYQFYQIPAVYQEAQNHIRSYLAENAGATTRIYDYLAPRLSDAQE